MDIGKAFAFVFEDEAWVKKVAIGVLWTLLSIFILPVFVVIGYGVAVARNVRDGLERPLPEWDNYGELFRDGLTVGVAQFIYSLPAVVLIIVGGISAGIGSATEIDAAAFLGGGVLILLGCLAFAWLLALVAISPAIYVQYLKHGTLGACLEFGEVLNMTRDNLSEILVAVLVIFGANALLTVLGFVPCLGIIVAFASFSYLTMFSGHIYGQLAANIIGGKGNKYDNVIMPDDMI